MILGTQPVCQSCVSVSDFGDKSFPRLRLMNDPVAYWERPLEAQQPRGRLGQLLAISTAVVELTL